MWTLPRPTTPPLTAYRTSISKVKNRTLKTRFKNVEGEVVAASEAFEAAAQTGTLHQLAHPPLVGNQVTAKEMIGLYDKRFAKKGSPGRDIYDAIFVAASQCPLCGHGTVMTLDHHLPKTHYPALTVTPLNLVPACADCNKNKTATIPLTTEEVAIHPYFDNFQGDEWLVAEVVQVVPAALTFDVQRSANWTDVLEARVRRQFQMLKLGNLYSSQAATEISNIRHYLVALFDSGGIQAVTTHLTQAAASRAEHRINSWQTATYRALANSAWYCAGGFA